MKKTAKEYATAAHEGQTRLNGEPYINHPQRVADRAKQHGPEYAEAAWLHDVVEDTEATLDDLIRAGFSRSVVDAVEALTKRDGEDYGDFVIRCSQNPIAKVVKSCDVKDNLRNVEQYKPKLKPRYVQALEYLNTH